MSHPQKPKIMYPPVWMVACLAAAWLLDQYLPIFHWVPVGLEDFVTRTGKYLGLAALTTIFLIGVQFRRAKTDIIPYREAKTLLTDGLYRYSRNPIYVMMLVVIVSFALILGSITAVLPALVFPTIINRNFIFAEEAMLEETFGDDYRTYKARVRRWL